MNSEDAVTLLTDASQMKDCKDVEKVAEALKVLRPVDDLFLCVRLSSRTWRCRCSWGSCWSENLA